MFYFTKTTSNRTGSPASTSLQQQPSHFILIIKKLIVIDSSASCMAFSFSIGQCGVPKTISMDHFDGWCCCYFYCWTFCLSNANNYTNKLNSIKCCLLRECIHSNTQVWMCFIRFCTKFFFIFFVHPVEIGCKMIEMKKTSNDCISNSKSQSIRTFTFVNLNAIKRCNLAITFVKKTTLKMYAFMTKY